MIKKATLLLHSQRPTKSAVSKAEILYKGPFFMPTWYFMSIIGCIVCFTLKTEVGLTGLWGQVEVPSAGSLYTGVS